MGVMQVSAVLSLGPNGAQPTLLHQKRGRANTRDTIQDAVLGAFGIFLTQSPSFLEYQRLLQHTTGRNNAQTLLGVEQIPCDNQVRTLLDPLTPSSLEPVFETIFKALEQHCRFDHFRVEGVHLLRVLDGSTCCSSRSF